MEAFESFVAVALETDGFVVSEAVKFPVRRKTGKLTYPEEQTHRYEVDLVAARSDRLILVTVKSFFGSRGVVADHVMGAATSDNGRRLYPLLPQPHDSRRRRAWPPPIATATAPTALRAGFTSAIRRAEARQPREADPSVGRHAARERRTHR